MNPGYGPKGVTGKWAGDKTPKGYGISQIQNYTPEQMQLSNQQYSHLGPDSYLSKLAMGDQSQFDEIEAPAFRQFNELQGNLASRFSQGGGGRGAMSSRHSSGFQNASTSAASNFAQDLASKRQQLQQNAIKDLLGLSNTILGQRPYERDFYEKPQRSSGLGGAIGAGLGGLGGFFLGGPGGALAGAQLGHGIGGGFDSGGSGQGMNWGAGKELISSYNNKWGGGGASQPDLSNAWK